MPPGFSELRPDELKAIEFALRQRPEGASRLAPLKDPAPEDPSHAPPAAVDENVAAALREVEAGSEVIGGVTVYPSPQALRAILDRYLENIQTRPTP